MHLNYFIAKYWNKIMMWSDLFCGGEICIFLFAYLWQALSAVTFGQYQASRARPGEKIGMGGFAFVVIGCGGELSLQIGTGMFGDAWGGEWDERATNEHRRAVNLCILQLLGDFVQ